MLWLAREVDCGLITLSRGKLRRGAGWIANKNMADEKEIEKKVEGDEAAKPEAEKK
jgi:hypothetical protein